MNSISVPRGATRAKRKVTKFKHELKKEFRLHRCLFHHYDVIDFTVFEFGMRVPYVVWRVLCLILIPLATVSLSDDILSYSHKATPYSGFIYMHIWLATLLTISLLIDVIALCWAFIEHSTCELVCLQYVPCYFRVMWWMYNIVYSNIMSCTFMYVLIFSVSDDIGVQYYLFLGLSAYAAIHVGTTAIPSRIGHFLHPLTLTLIYIFFTAIYQYNLGTNPKGDFYVYREMDWAYKLQSILVAIVWMVVTFVCHVSIVFGSWSRRLLYHRLRKGKEAVMNPDPDDDSSLCSVDLDGEYLEEQPSPRIWIEDIPGDTMGHKRVVIESPPPARKHAPHQAVFHEVYRDSSFPPHPGDRRKRLIVETSPVRRPRGYCFAAADHCGKPRRYLRPRDLYTRARPMETSFICHPDVSPDGTSTVYKCMPEHPTQPPECFACEDERRVDRYEYSNRVHSTKFPQHDPPLPKLYAYKFQGDRGPIQTQTFVCPREKYGTTKFTQPAEDTDKHSDTSEDEARNRESSSKRCRDAPPVATPKTSSKATNKTATPSAKPVSDKVKGKPSVKNAKDKKKVSITKAPKDDKESSPSASTPKT